MITIFSAELFAVNEVIKMIEEDQSESKNYIIHSDSISALISLKQQQPTNAMVAKTLEKIYEIS